MAKRTSLVALLLLMGAGMAFGAYSGAYTVGSGGYFANPYVAGESIRTYGINGNVTLNIIAGSYTLPSYIYLYSVSGASSYTMTWKPQNAGDVVNITYNSSYVFYIAYTNNVKIQDLNIFNSSSWAIYCDYNCSGVRIEHCTIRSPNGIQFYYYCNDDSIISNDIKVTSSYGLYFYNGNTAYRNVIIGNLINYGSASYGIYQYYGYYFKYFYNTVVGQGSYGFMSQYASYDTLRNNIFQGASYAYYRYNNSGTYPDSSDYNCYWIYNGNTSSTVIYNSSYGAGNLAWWKSLGTGRDVRSIQQNPLTAYPSNLRLRTGSPCIDSGNRPYSYPPPTAACTLDIDGSSRNYNATPDIGAFEWAGATALNGIYHIKAGTSRADTFPTFGASISAIALRGMSGGVTFHVMAGTYSEGQIDFTNPGNGANWVTWKPDTTGVKPVIDAGNSSYAIYANGAKRLRWQGLTIQNFASYGFYLQTNTGVSPWCTPDTLVINGNTINGPNGINLYTYYGGSDDSILNNTINATSNYGIYAYGSTSYYAYRNVFINNMITGWTSSGIHMYGYWYYPKLFNNTIVGTGSYAFYEYYCYYDTLRGNILQANSYAWYRYYGSNPPDYSNYNAFWINGGSTGSATIYNSSYGGGALSWWRSVSGGRDANSIQWNPQTAAPLNPHLKNGSPCIDSGGAVYSGINRDIDGQSRPYGSYIDIGADEWANDIGAPMSGIYTVKQAGGGDYLSIAAAFGDLALRGNSGNVQFDVYAGTYPRVDFTGITTSPYRLILRAYPGQNPTINAGGASYAVNFYNTKKVHFEGFNITNFSNYGIYLSSYYPNQNTSDSNAIVGNTITGYNGIYCNYGNDDTFFGNTISFTSSYGIYLYGYSGVPFGARNVVANNMVFGTGSYPFMTAYQNGLKVVYNSFYGPSAGYAWYDQYSYGGPSYIQQVRRNNIFVGSTYAYYCYYYNGSSSYPDSSDNNDFRTTGGSGTPIQHAYGGAMSLATWRTNSGNRLDSASISADPVFTSGTNLHILSSSPCRGTGKAYSSYTTDIDGDPRGTPPCMGADEFYVDVATRAIFAPTGLVNPFSSVTPSVAYKYVRGPGALTFKVFTKLVRKTGGAQIYMDSTTRTQAVGDSFVVNFTPWSTPTSWSDTVYTTTWCRATGDAVPANDTVTNAFKTGLIDCSVIAIDTPTGIVGLGTTVYPRMRVRNNGNYNAAIQVIYTIDDYTDGPGAPRGTPIKVGALSARGSEDVASINPGTVSSGTPKSPVDAEVYRSVRVLSVVPPGRDTFVRFPTAWLATPLGSYFGRCSLTVTNDMVFGNDTLDAPFTVQSTLHDVAVTRILAPTVPIDSGASVTPACSVYNYGGYSETYTVRMKIGTGYNQTATVTSHGISTRAYVTFPDWTATTRGGNAVSCSTELSTDANRSNDKLTGTVLVNVLDVGVVGIAYPIGSIDSAVNIAPSARVHNYGTVPATFTTYFSFPGYTDNFTITGLAAGADSVITFATWPKPHAPAAYATVCSTVCAGDVIPTNNLATGSFRITFQVADTGWSRKADVPGGAKNKAVKDGGSLAYFASDTGDVYALKGNSRYEFYKYNTLTNTWSTPESIPAIGRAGKKKAVKKGASLTSHDNRVYATKGNGTVEFWRYSPDTLVSKRWSQLADVTLGTKTIKEGSGMVALNQGDSSFVYLLKGSGTQEFYRYNLATNAWTAKASAPVGISGKAFKDGSCIAVSEDGKTIFAVKGNYNEFYSYNVDSNAWKTLAPVPLIGASGKKIKVKSGAGAAFYSGNVYVVKGNNKLEAWKYQVDSNKWTQLASMPSGGGKNAKGGGALVYSPSPTPSLFAFKGNNTLEFYKYGFQLDVLNDTRSSSNALSNSTVRTSDLALRISPNPFSNATTISYSLPNAGSISLKLYDVTGKLITTLASGSRNAGTYNLLTAPGLASGIYLLKLETDNSSTTSKLIIE